MDTVVSIEQILLTLKKHFKIILAAVIVCLAAALAVTYFAMTPKYTTSSQILVNRKHSDDAGAQLNQVQADVQMISTYKDIITNPIILNDVAAKLQGKNEFTGNAAEIKAMIDVSSEQNSQVFSVNVKTTNPYLAADIANETATVFQRKIKKIMSVNNVSIISRATVNKKQVSPVIWINCALGIAIGLVLGILLAILREYLDKTVKDAQFITDQLDLPNLGLVFEIPEDTKSLAQITKDATQPPVKTRRVKE